MCAGGGVHIEPRYRQFPQLTKSQVVQAEFFSGTMWFWILWRFWHDSDAVLESGKKFQAIEDFTSYLKVVN
ncbi:NADH dehydrogenase [ubiquinone] 1 beta subcomplex subunit 2 [Prionailurus iriomotensis]